MEHLVPDEHVQEVDEGELYEGGEDGHEAKDDEHVQSSGISNLTNTFVLHKKYKTKKVIKFHYVPQPQRLRLTSICTHPLDFTVSH